jgi:hypothetical protein
MRGGKRRKAGGWLVLAVLGCVAGGQWRGQGVDAALPAPPAQPAPARRGAAPPAAALRAVPSTASPAAARREHIKQHHKRQHHAVNSINANVLVRHTGPDHRIRRRVQRAIADHLIFGGGGVSVDQLAGAETVGDVKALATLTEMDPGDLDMIGVNSRPVRLLFFVCGRLSKMVHCLMLCFTRWAAPDLPSVLVSVSVNVCECSAWVRFPSMEMLCPSTSLRVKETMKM